MRLDDYPRVPLLFGPSPLHRSGFAPVAQAELNFGPVVAAE